MKETCWSRQEVTQNHEQQEDLLLPTKRDMSAAPEVLSPQNGAEHTGCWQGVPFIRTKCEKALEPPSARLMNGDASSSGDELNTKVRKPYTITKQRERWTEDEHQKFLEALKLYGRAWRRIAEHIGTKTAVQIRSHAQKFFSKLEREASNGGSTGKSRDIEIPPPRPKRKPNHPYPRKAGVTSLNSLSPMDEESRASPAAYLMHTSAVSSLPASKGSCQPAAFTPYIGKRGPVLDATILHNSSINSTDFLGPEGRLKLFGKTVLVPSAQKTAAQKDLREIAIKENTQQGSPAADRILPASMQTGKGDLKHKTGFVPYVKVGKKLVSSSDDALSSGMNASGSGISALEGTDESNVEIPCMPLLKVHCTGEGLTEDGKLKKQLNTNLQDLAKYVSDQTTNKETSELNRDSCENVPDKECVSHSNSAAANMDKPFAALLSPQNSAAYLWMDSLFRYYGSLPALSLGACCPTDRQSNSPNIPWQFLQAATMTHPAAYAAAIAMAGWTQLSSGGQTPAANDTYSVPPSLDDVSASAFTAAAASWWAMRGFVSPGFVHPPAGAISQCVDHLGSLANVASGTFVQNFEILADTVKQDQDQTSDPATDDEAATSENNTDRENTGEDECIEINKPRNDFGTLESKDSGYVSSSATAAAADIHFEEREILCEAKMQCEVQRPDIYPEVHLPNIIAQEVEKAKIVTEQAEQSPCSSADEIDTGLKNPREGSSSGSNTPVFRHHSSESETPHTSGSDVKGKDDFGKQHGTCDGITGHCLGENHSKGSSCPKMRFKHLEKGRKHQHKDFRHGDDYSVKRFKSCAQEMDLRKEVSQEVRKAFQALFTCRTLPQTFPSVLTSESMRKSARILNQDVLMDSVTVDAEGASCLLTQSEKDCIGCIESCGPLSETVSDDQKEVREGEHHFSGCTDVVSTSITYTETGISSSLPNRRDCTEESVKRQYLSISKEVDNKIFSGRSGFVPYKRPAPKIHLNSRSAPSSCSKKHFS